jgi:neutral ceramidase
MLQVGLSRESITPDKGIPLAGYFNPRPNTGVLDELFVRTILFKKDKVITGLMAFDLCFLSTAIIERIKTGLRENGLDFCDNLIFSATHTHTGPYVDDFFGEKADENYLEYLRGKAVSAIKLAYADLSPAELSIGSVNNNPRAFNRRYWMKNGKVLTNPGSLNPDVVRPEGPVDTEIGVITVKQEGRIRAVITNIVNHTDTIGGDFVSADWPGRMEKEIQNFIGNEVSVITLIGCSGNINHFDIENKAGQTSYAEACRIGKGYAEIVYGELNKLERLPVEKIEVSVRNITIPFRIIIDEEVRKAKTTIAMIGNTVSQGDMTSEGLAEGAGPVAKFFAEQLIAYKKNCSGKSRKFKLISVKFDDRLVFTSIPGEAFTEIGLEIKKRSPFKYTWPITLAMGECGYIPLPGCFSRGGYEILPVEGGAPREDTAELLIKETLANLK